MRSIPIALACLVPALATPAAAGTTIGVTAGTNSNVTDGTASQPAVTGLDPGGQTLGVFARVHLVSALSLQAEALKVTSTSKVTDSDLTLRSANAVLVAELGHGTWVPIMLAGVGVDYAQAPSAAQWGFAPSEMFTHYEIGIGLELHVAGGLVIGVDGRVGQRSGPPPQAGHGYEPCDPVCAGDPSLIPPPATFNLGPYNVVRVSLGARF